MQCGWVRPFGTSSPLLLRRGCDCGAAGVEGKSGALNFSIGGQELAQKLNCAHTPTIVMPVMDSRAIGFMGRKRRACQINAF